jgi:protein subunit release factor A
MAKITLEIRPGEGGIDSQQFVAELATAYLACAAKEN